VKSISRRTHTSRTDPRALTDPEIVRFSCGMTTAAEVIITPMRRHRHRARIATSCPIALGWLLLERVKSRQLASRGHIRSSVPVDRRTTPARTRRALRNWSADGTGSRSPCARQSLREHIRGHDRITNWRCQFSTFRIRFMPRKMMRFEAPEQQNDLHSLWRIGRRRGPPRQRTQPG